MSVQVGIWNFDDRPVDRDLLARFNESLTNQAPDGEFSYVEGSIALLYRPFHTNVESRAEVQPYHSKRNSILTWDGRLDNRGDLITELRGELHADPSDVAIVAAAFDRWSNDCFRHIVGDWAVSIWKPSLRELTLACDYIATRHIFYHLKNNRIWWASDLAPLVLLAGEKFHIDDDYIAGYFANDPSSHLTPYREIREVPAGQFVIIRDRCASIERHWRFSATSRIRYRNDTEYEEHFRQLFRQSVWRRLRSDSPILAELSGGLDSSSIVCMADDILRNGKDLTPRLDTLSYCDSSEPNGDDSIYRQQVEEKRKRVGIHIDGNDYGDVASFEYPGFVPLPGYFGAIRNIQERRNAVIREGGYRIVLSGIGGDEFLGGVPNPAAQLADLIVKFKILTLLEQAFSWSLVKRKPFVQLIWDALVELFPRSLSQHLAKQAKVEPWINEEFAHRASIATHQLDVTEHFGLWLPTRRSQVGGVLLMGNKMSKRNVRQLPPTDNGYPYLDQDLVEFILSIPATQLLRAGERRSLMRRALVGIVPQEVLSRRTKQIASRTPVRALENNVNELVSAFQSPLSSALGYVDKIKFLDSVQAARAGKVVHMTRLQKTISLEFWLRHLVPRGVLAKATDANAVGARASVGPGSRIAKKVP
jgi:asparagine synthase (glutamine-hydrolysing)